MSRETVGYVDYLTCWACKFEHHDERWHTWADADDAYLAGLDGKPDPTKQRCGCFCQKGGRCE